MVSNAEHYAREEHRYRYFTGSTILSLITKVGSNIFGRKFHCLSSTKARKNKHSTYTPIIQAQLFHRILRWPAQEIGHDVVVYHSP